MLKYNWGREKLCTAYNFSKYEIVISISAAQPAFQFCCGLIPGLPPFPVLPGVFSSVNFQGSEQQVQTKAASCWTLCNVAFWPCFSFLASSSVMSAPEILSPYYLFDILVHCFSYCCPTLVVRWAVLLSKTLDRWTGLYYPRWVYVPVVLSVLNCEPC